MIYVDKNTKNRALVLKISKWQPIPVTEILITLNANHCIGLRDFEARSCYNIHGSLSIFNKSTFVYACVRARVCKSEDALLMSYTHIHYI